MPPRHSTGCIPTGRQRPLPSSLTTGQASWSVPATAWTATGARRGTPAWPLSSGRCGAWRNARTPHGRRVARGRGRSDSACALGPRPHRRVGNGGPGSLGCVDCWRRIMTAPMTPDGWPAACSARWMPCGFSSASPVWTRPTSGPREPGGVVCPGAQPVSGDGKHQGAALSGTDPVAQSDLPSPRQSHLHRAGGRRQPFFLWPTT